MLKRGFSLMEMMIVMLIVAVVAAASAPMINKKMLQDQANESPWVWTGTDNSIAYNLKGTASQTAVIGAIVAPKDAYSKLHIESDAGSHITLGDGDPNGKHLKIGVDNNSIWLSNVIPAKNSVVIGTEVDASDGEDGVAIGKGTSILDHNYGVAIGSGAFLDQNGYKYGIAIGASSFAGDYCVAIGGKDKDSSTRTQADNNSVAIGAGSQAVGESSIAIGSGSKVLGTSNNAIAIGASSEAPGVSSIALGYAKSGKHGIAIGGKHSHVGTKTEAGQAGVSIGCGTQATGQGAIAIGTTGYHSSGTSTPTIATADQSIAIGRGAQATSDGAIAIGDYNEATSSYTTALGWRTYATHSNSTAIGTGARTTASNQIMLGSAESKPTVYIPGDLVVDGDISFKNITVTGNLTVNGNSYLGKSSGSRVWIGVARPDGDKWAISKLIKEDTGTEGRRSIRVNAETGDHTSDRRLKNVGEAFKAGLAEIKKLEVFNYTFKDDKDKTPRVGVMAQDLQKIFPKAVFKGEDGFLRIRMEDMFYALVNAVKELDAKINLLEQKQKRIDELEKRLDKLEKRLEKLEKGK